MRKIFLAGTAMLLAGAGVASAADVLPAPYVEAPVYEAPVQTVSAAGGWYLRGDVGYSWNKMKGAEFFQGGLGTYAPFATASLRNSDITSVSGLSLLANAYVDLYKKGRFTFYAGGGLGGTRVKWDDLNNTSCSTANPTLCDPSFNHGGAAGWRFTYALMAGASIDVTCAVKADVGYRYRHISGGNMFKSLTSNGYQGQHKAITSHEVRGGLRYGFGGCAEQEVYVEPAPIMPVIYK